MLQLFADFYPMMVFAISFAAVLYIPGLLIVVQALRDKRVWIEDADGGLHLQPDLLSE